MTGPVRTVVTCGLMERDLRSVMGHQGRRNAATRPFVFVAVAEWREHCPWLMSSHLPVSQPFARE